VVGVIGIGVVTMLAGLLTLFAMVVGVVAPGLVLSFSAYAATFVGLLLGVFGLAQRTRRRR
jgi:hypothetical protein